MVCFGPALIPAFSQTRQVSVDSIPFCNDSLQVYFGSNDTVVFYDCIKYAEKDSLSEKPMGEIIEKLALYFKDVPYGSPAGKGARQNKLVVGFEKFNCVTFVETILAISRCVRDKKTTFRDFARELSGIRYRNGKMGGYTSRLHYFSEWIYDNEARKIVSDLSGVIDTVPYTKKISYMTANKRKYRKLKDKKLFAEMRELEKQLSSRRRHYLPKEGFDKYKISLKNGDIISFTTSITGLDVTHTGFAIWAGDEIYLLHASSQYHKVMLSKTPLKEYMAAKKKNTGILVARPL